MQTKAGTKQWEYKKAFITDVDDNLIEELDEYGKHGWELVTAKDVEVMRQTVYRCIFKRLYRYELPPVEFNATFPELTEEEQQARAQSLMKLLEEVALRPMFNPGMREHGPR
jgi:hypothetical protein